jgi:hypothetical protein
VQKERSDVAKGFDLVEDSNRSSSRSLHDLLGSGTPHRAARDGNDAACLSCSHRRPRVALPRPRAPVPQRFKGVARWR